MGSGQTTFLKMGGFPPPPGIWKTKKPGSFRVKLVFKETNIRQHHLFVFVIPTRNSLTAKLLKSLTFSSPCLSLTLNQVRSLLSVGACTSISLHYIVYRQFFSSAINISMTMLLRRSKMNWSPNLESFTYYIESCLPLHTLKSKMNEQAMINEQKGIT